MENTDRRTPVVKLTKTTEDDGSFLSDYEYQMLGGHHLIDLLPDGMPECIKCKFKVTVECYDFDLEEAKAALAQEQDWLYKCPNYAKHAAKIRIGLLTDLLKAHDVGE